MKDDSNPADNPGESLVRIVDALNEMRDALIVMSLALHDYKFDLDSSERERLDQLSQKLIEKSKRLKL